MPDCWNNLYYVFRHNFFLKNNLPRLLNTPSSEPSFSSLGSGLGSIAPHPFLSCVYSQNTICSYPRVSSYLQRQGQTEPLLVTQI